MTSKPKAPPTKLNIYADQLRDAITLVKPFVGVDDTLPMLRGYRFEVHGGDLYVFGTDRYTLAVARVVAVDEQKFPAGFTAFVPASLAARALMLFKPPRGGVRLPLVISTSGKWTGIENVPHGEDEPPTRLVGEVIGEQKDIGVRKMCSNAIQNWRDAQKAEAVAPTVGIDPVFTARIAVVQKVLGRCPVVMRACAHNKPIIFTAEDFFVMQMPMRLGGQTATDVDAWAERFAEPEPVAEKPARKAPAKKATPRRRAS